MAGSIIKTPESEIDQITKANDKITIHFSCAYLIKSEGIPQVDPSSLWRQEANLHIHSQAMQGELTQTKQLLKSTQLTSAGYTYVDLIPTGLSNSDHAELTLEFEDGSTLNIQGENIDLETIGLPKYIKHM